MHLTQYLGKISNTELLYVYVIFCTQEMIHKACQVSIHSFIPSFILSFIHNWGMCHGKAEWRVSLERKSPCTGRLSPEFTQILGDKYDSDSSFSSQQRLLSEGTSSANIRNLQNFACRPCNRKPFTHPSNQRGNQNSAGYK